MFPLKNLASKDLIDVKWTLFQISVPVCKKPLPKLMLINFPYIDLFIIETQ